MFTLAGASCGSWREETLSAPVQQDTHGALGTGMLQSLGTRSHAGQRRLETVLLACCDSVFQAQTAQ